MKALTAQRPMKGTMRRTVKKWSRRLPRGETRYLMVQKAPFVAETLRRSAPAPATFRLGREAALKEVKKILKMSLGRHEGRTPLPKLRAAIARVARASRSMRPEGRDYVARVLDEMAVYLGWSAVNTDRAFKPFAEVLCAVLQLAGLSRHGRPPWVPR